MDRYEDFLEVLNGSDLFRLMFKFSFAFIQVIFERIFIL